MQLTEYLWDDLVSAPSRFLRMEVVDIFGNDTMTIVDMSVEKNGEKK